MGKASLASNLSPPAFGDTYYVLSSSGRCNQCPWHALTEDSASSLFDTDNGADYILITHRDVGWDINGDPLAGWLEDLVRPFDRIRAFEWQVVDIEDIYDEFSYGIKSPQALKRFSVLCIQQLAGTRPSICAVGGRQHL